MIWIFRLLGIQFEQSSVGDWTSMLLSPSNSKTKRQRLFGSIDFFGVLTYIYQFSRKFDLRDSPKKLLIGASGGFDVKPLILALDPRELQRLQTIYPSSIRR